jgi:squalene synthase HpnC
LLLIAHSLENDWVPGNRAPERTDVRPSVTRAQDVAANAAGENFPVALCVLPEAYRRHLTALYCFARLTDDLGDEAEGDEAEGDEAEGSEDQVKLRLKLLDELTADVHRIYDGQHPNAPALRALADTVKDCGVPAQPLLDLIQANRQDQQVTRYATLAELQQYCDLSANPVGRVVLYIFGAATEERIALSDRICTALQLAEHWQDVAEDLGKGRIYLPKDDLDRFGVTEADLAEPTAGQAVRTLMAFEVARARRMMDEGAPLVGTLHGAARLAVAGYVAGGRAALAAIKAQRYDVLKSTARPRKRRLAAELVKTYLSRR